MDGSAPSLARRWIEGDPVEIAPGVVTIAHCARCGGGLIPADHRSAYCSNPCRAAAKAESPARKAGDARRAVRSYAAHQSYRMARRALRAAGMDLGAADVLKGRGKVDDWRAIVGLPPPQRGVKRASKPAAKRAPWRAAVGPQPEHIAWGLELGGIPASAAARHIHGLVSHLVSADHAQVARWALAMLTGAQGRSGWGAVLFRRDDAERLRGLTRGVMVGSARLDLRVGAAVHRLRAPVLLSPGRYRVTIDAVTPVSHMIAGRTKPVTQPTVDTITRCAGDLLQRTGLTTGRMHIASVACETAPERVVIGGHVGPITGWVGRVVVECNAPAAWALSLARHAGLGGRVAYGLGRVRVEVTPWR